MSTESVLVTGVTGFLGKNIAIDFIHKGFDVIGIGRNPSVVDELEGYGLDIKKADIRDINQLKNVFKNIDYVVHSAALSSPWGKYSDFYETNVIGTKNVLEYAKDAGVKKFIHISTPSIYFDFSDKEMIKEESELPQKFCNYYALTKHMAERLVDKANEEGLFTVALRPRAIFGIGDNAIFPRLIAANRKIGVPIVDGGHNLIDITSVENVVQAVYLSVISSNDANGQKFNITNGEPMEFMDILTRLFHYLKIELKTLNISYKTLDKISSLLEFVARHIFIGAFEPYFTKYSAAVLAKTQTLDISKAKNVLGYSPIISTEESLRKFAKEWRSKEKYGGSNCD